MFKALAEFIMRGRYQAISMALLGSFIPLMSQGAQGLVTLRKGWQEGAIISAFACLPAVIGLWFASTDRPFVWASIAVLVLTYVGACILRYTLSWALTLMASVGFSIAAALFIVSFSADSVESVEKFFGEILQKSAADTEPEKEMAALFVDWTGKRAAGLLAWWIGLVTILGLFVSRWWQALLYKPGGFQQEFHSLRLPVTAAVPCLLVTVYCLTQGVDYYFWALLCGAPLFMAGLAFVHWLIAGLKLGYAAVVVLYVMLPLLSPAVGALMLIAAVDSVFDLRKFLRLNQP